MASENYCASFRQVIEFDMVARDGIKPLPLRGHKMGTERAQNSRFAGFSRVLYGGLSSLYLLVTTGLTR
jgi:hypothetical protein